MNDIIVDVDGKLGMSEAQKNFILAYCQYRDIEAASMIAEIDTDTAKRYFVSFDTQEEIRRINRLLYQKQFEAKMLSLDEIGGYLTSVIMGESADKLKANEKLSAVKLLIELNALKSSVVEHPEKLSDVETQLHDLSLDAIKSMLSVSKRKKAVEVEYKDVTPEESAYLSTLPTDELLKLIEKEKNKDV